MVDAVLAIVITVLLVTAVPNFTFFLWMIMPAESIETGYLNMLIGLTKVVFYFPASLFFIAISRITTKKPYNYMTHVITSFFRYVMKMDLLTLRFLMDLPGFLARSIVTISNTSLADGHGRWYGEYVDPKDPDAIFIFFIHGGGFSLGSPILYLYSLPFFRRMFKRKKIRLMTAKYTLSPGVLYPAAINELIEGYKYFCRVVPPNKMMIMGDSAGGNLVMALLIKIYTEYQQLPLPKACALISPWLDLSKKAQDYIPAPHCYLKPEFMEMLVNVYVPPGTDLTLSTVSPYFASEEELTMFNYMKLLVTFGGEELLAPEGKEFAERVKQVCGPEQVTIQSEPNQVHVYQMLGGIVLGSDATRGGRDLAQWIEEQFEMPV